MFCSLSIKLIDWLRRKQLILFLENLNVTEAKPRESLGFQENSVSQLTSLK